MMLSLNVDRFEGERGAIAVLLAEDGRQIEFPRDLLPKGTKSGDVLSVTIESDAKATRELKKRTRALQSELETRDPGGDVQL